MRLLMVCLGNICRSPTAEAAVREAAAAAGIDLEVESAGTGAWHIGEPPDARMRAAAAEDGLIVEGEGRQVVPTDLDRYDLVLAMDRSNLRELERMATTNEQRAKLHLFRSFDDGADDLEVPDPYYGGPDGFRNVVRIARDSAAGLVEAIAHGRIPKAQV